jgi:hypothetical protein
MPSCEWYAPLALVGLPVRSERRQRIARRRRIAWLGKRPHWHTEL